MGRIGIETPGDLEIKPPEEREPPSQIKMQSTESVQNFLKIFIEWASNQPDIQAVALVGSYAKGNPTETSDIDLVIVVDDPNRYLENPDWPRRFGKIRQVQIEDYRLVTSLRVWYLDGMEVEYGLTTQDWIDPPIDEGTRKVIHNGFHSLLDRKGLLGDLEQ